jgi:hypothetical protein
LPSHLSQASLADFHPLQTYCAVAGCARINREGNISDNFGEKTVIVTGQAIKQVQQEAYKEWSDRNNHIPGL